MNYNLFLPMKNSPANIFALCAAWLLSGAPGALCGQAAPLRLALVENTPTVLTLQLVQPVERVLRQAGQDARLGSVGETSCFFSGESYRLLLPQEKVLTEPSASGSVLEGDAEIILISPSDSSLEEALVKAAADPESFRRPNSIALRVTTASVSLAEEDGKTALRFKTSLVHPASALPHSSPSEYYRFRWYGRDISLAVVSRAYGGLGRLKELVRRESLKGPLVGVARGGVFEGRASGEALEAAGLRYSAVAGAELRNLDELLAYRGERPAGVLYLSANLVYSTSTETTVLPGYAVFEASGTRVALIGLTPAWTSRFLGGRARQDLMVKDPAAALDGLIPVVRRLADVVIVLSALSPEMNANLASLTRGIDLIFADDAPFLNFTAPPETVLREAARPPFSNPLPVVRVYSPALNLTELSSVVPGGPWEIRQRAILLDDSIAQDIFREAPPPAPAGPDRVLIPAARDVFPQELRAGLPVYNPQDFWTLSAGMLAAAAGAEAGLLPIGNMTPPTVGEVRESVAAAWLSPGDSAVVVGVSGSELASLAAGSSISRKVSVAAGSVPDQLPLAISGFDPDKGFVGTTPFDPDEIYFLATSRLAAEQLGLQGPYKPLPGSVTVSSAVLAGLRSVHKGASPAQWRNWMTGEPTEERGLWRVNFREAGLNARNTKVQRPSDFDPVPNARVQGIDEVMLGWSLKVDAEYLRRRGKWTSTAELEYAKNRLSPRDYPPLTSLSANRTMFLTLATLRAGEFPYGWLARSWGPSLGLEAEGEFQSVSGRPRKRVYSAFPGLELYGGSVINTLEATASLKRDYSDGKPNTQYGLRLRALFSAPLYGLRLNGEFWNKYFFHSRHDSPGDLLVEGNASLRMNVPVYSRFSLSPFVDFYWFGLKAAPKWGYSLMTGVSLGFSRLWKPQHENLLK